MIQTCHTIEPCCAYRKHLPLRIIGFDPSDSLRCDNRTDPHDLALPIVEIVPNSPLLSSTASEFEGTKLQSPSLDDVVCSGHDSAAAANDDEDDAQSATASSVTGREITNLEPFPAYSRPIQYVVVAVVFVTAVAIPLISHWMDPVPAVEV